MIGEPLRQSEMVSRGVIMPNTKNWETRRSRANKIRLNTKSITFLTRNRFRSG